MHKIILFAFSDVEPHSKISIFNLPQPKGVLKNTNLQKIFPQKILYSSSANCSITKNCVLLSFILTLCGQGTVLGTSSAGFRGFILEKGEKKKTRLHANLNFLNNN